MFLDEDSGDRRASRACYFHGAEGGGDPKSRMKRQPLGPGVLCPKVEGRDVFLSPFPGSCPGKTELFMTSVPSNHRVQILSGGAAGGPGDDSISAMISVGGKCWRLGGRSLPESSQPYAGHSCDLAWEKLGSSAAV